MFSCDTPSNPGPAVLTLVNSLGSYIIPQTKLAILTPVNFLGVFCVYFILTHAHPRKLPGRSPIPNCSKPSTLNLEVFSR
jgi:hypothetical protein